jgi:hypothetical protein
MLDPRKSTSPANPGANSFAVLYDGANSARPTPPFATAAIEDSTGRGRVQVVALLDQNFAINTYWAADVSSALRLVRADAYTGGSGGFVKAVRCAQPVTVVAKANLANNDYFTVTYTTVIDGVTVETVKVFEYKVVAAGFVATEGRIVIDVIAATTDVSVAVLTATAVRTAFVATASQPALTVAVPTSATFTIKGQSGPRFAVVATENVSNAGFTIGTKVDGVEGTVVDYDARLKSGRNRIVLVTGTAPEEWDVSVTTIDTVDPGV